MPTGIWITFYPYSSVSAEWQKQKWSSWEADLEKVCYWLPQILLIHRYNSTWLSGSRQWLHLGWFWSYGFTWGRWVFRIWWDLANRSRESTVSRVIYLSLLRNISSIIVISKELVSFSGSLWILAPLLMLTSFFLRQSLTLRRQCRHLR